MKRNITFKQLLVFMSVFFLATPLIAGSGKLSYQGIPAVL